MKTATLVAAAIAVVVTGAFLRPVEDVGAEPALHVEKLRLYSVARILGRVAQSVGPWPTGAERACDDARKEFMEKADDKLREGALPKLKGRTLRPGDVNVTCEWLSSHPPFDNFDDIREDDE